MSGYCRPPAGQAWTPGLVKLENEVTFQFDTVGVSTRNLEFESL